MKTNFHTHSTFCDGKNTPEEIVLSVDQSMKDNQIHSWYVDMVLEDVIDDLREQ